MSHHIVPRPLTLEDSAVAGRWGDDPDFCAYAGWTVGKAREEWASPY